VGGLRDIIQGAPYANILKSATTTTSGSTTSTSASASCIGSKYTIKSKDTCQSISMSQGISTVLLLSQNNLRGYCTNFPTSGSLCIPTASQCTAYTIKTNDTCISIADGAHVTWAQVVSWNPSLGRACQNLPQYIGYVICISNPGGSYINPSPTTISVSSTSYT